LINDRDASGGAHTTNVNYQKENCPMLIQRKVLIGLHGWGSWGGPQRCDGSRGSGATLLDVREANFNVEADSAKRLPTSVTSAA